MSEQPEQEAGKNMSGTKVPNRDSEAPPRPPSAVPLSTLGGHPLTSEVPRENSEQGSAAIGADLPGAKTDEFVNKAARGKPRDYAYYRAHWYGCLSLWGSKSV